MSNLVEFAKLELDAIGMKEGNDEYGDAMRKDILDIVQVFADQGHSGFSANWVCNALEKLLRYEPLAPLTGEDDEWTDISQYSVGKIFQNKRCSHVFKEEDGHAYDINGIVFWEWVTDTETGEKFKSYYTGPGSRVFITFPYTPTVEYTERQTGSTIQDIKPEED